jgi:hypothetical protein
MKYIKPVIKKLKKTLEDGTLPHMVMDQHTNVYPIESNLHIQCNPHQNSNAIFQRNGKINPKIHMET